MSSAFQQAETPPKKTKNGKSFVAAMRKWAMRTKTNKVDSARRRRSNIPATSEQRSSV